MSRFYDNSNYNMEGEMRNFAMVWTTVVASLYYCHVIGKLTKPGPMRLVPIIPVVVLFLLLPLNLRTISLGGPTCFSVAWLSNFKLLLFAFGHAPLASTPPLPPSHFIALACFPIKIQHHHATSSSSSSKSPSMMSYAPKALLFSTIVPAFLKKDSFQPTIYLLLYTVYIYTGLEIILASVAAAARAALGVELEPQFHAPYLAKSLQDFWGGRWNVMVSRVLHPSVYIPARDLSVGIVGRKWAALPGVVAAFVASGVMHELVFYNIGRARPVGDVTLFFVLQGVCVAAEIGVKKLAGERKPVRVPGAVSGVSAVGFVVVTAVWLFLPALMRCRTDVMAYTEIIAVFEYVKGLVDF